MGAKGKSQKITKVIGVLHLGTMNVCTKFYGGPTRTCGDPLLDKLRL